MLAEKQITFLSKGAPTPRWSARHRRQRVFHPSAV